MEQRFNPRELYCSNEQKTYPGDASEAAFLIGGIGTGNISVGARGNLHSWQIFNEPGFNNYMPYTFFAIRTEAEGQVTGRVLEGEIPPPYAWSQGTLRSAMGGLPRFRGSRMQAQYPFVQVQMEDREVPVEVTMEAFTPFIPLNADDSGIPGAYIRYHVRNPRTVPVQVSVAGSLINPVGFNKYTLFNTIRRDATPVNEYREDGGIRGLWYTGTDIWEKHIANGSMALTTTDESVTAKPLWLQAEWTDGLEDFWDDFMADGRLDVESAPPGIGCLLAQKYDYEYLFFHHPVGSLCLQHTLAPGEEKTFEFMLSWCFPNRVKAWGETVEYLRQVEDKQYDVVRNYYADLFPDAWKAAAYLAAEKQRLEGGSRAFADAFFSSTLPGYLLEAVADNITVIRSPTCFRVQGGHFLGWEGVESTVGCGSGNCTHVWNYAQTVAYLFPELEQSMRRIEFVMEVQPDGHIPYRLHMPMGLPAWKMEPSADGQMGTVVRLYREWKLSGDDQLLKDCWPGLLKCMDYIQRTWDPDGDFVPEEPQSVTYDTELYGVNSMVGSIYLAALKGAAEMAEHMGDDARAKTWRAGYEAGSKKLDELTFNGEYYIQRIDDVDEYRYQYGTGCLGDQLLGQFMAFPAGLGHVLPKEHVKSAAQAMYRYDYLDHARDWVHGQRAYILNDERGLTPCTWPKGGRPRFPFVYYGEVWTGIEYEVAALLLYEGCVEEGLTLVKTVRDRQDGYRRNPFSENESGYYYVRAMGSYALLTAITGYHCDMTKNEMSFAPLINQDDFQTFWCNGHGWGTYRQKKNEQGQMEKEVKVLYENGPAPKLV